MAYVNRSAVEKLANFVFSGISQRDGWITYEDIVTVEYDDGRKEKEYYEDNTTKALRDIADGTFDDSVEPEATVDFYSEIQKRSLSEIKSYIENITGVSLKTTPDGYSNKSTYATDLIFESTYGRLPTLLELNKAYSSYSVSGSDTRSILERYNDKTSDPIDDALAKFYKFVFLNIPTWSEAKQDINSALGDVRSQIEYDERYTAMAFPQYSKDAVMLSVFTHITHEVGLNGFFSSMDYNDIKAKMSEIVGINLQGNPASNTPKNVYAAELLFEARYGKTAQSYRNESKKLIQDKWISQGKTPQKLYDDSVQALKNMFGKVANPNEKYVNWFNEYYLSNDTTQDNSNIQGGNMPKDVFVPLDKTDISKLYVSLFGRVSEKEGNDYWVNTSSSSKMDMAKMADNILELDIVKQYFGDSLKINFNFINFIYENTLNKSAFSGKGMEVDAAGVEYWTNALNTGAFTKGQIVAEMIKAVYDPKYNELDAAKLFKNKVALSNETANTIKSADINNLAPFVDAVKQVKPNSTTSDIKSIVKTTQDKLIGTNPAPNPKPEKPTTPTENNDGYRWEGNTLVIDKNKTGMITVDKIPQIIKVNGFLFWSSVAGGSEYQMFDSESELFGKITEGQPIYDVLSAKGKVDEYQIANDRYVIIEKNGKVSPSKHTYSPTEDLAIKIVGMPTSNEHYWNSNFFGDKDPTTIELMSF
jgi:surface layer protein sapB9